MFFSRRSSPHFSLEITFLMLALMGRASLGRAQAPKTDYELNTPYVCPNGASYTFTKRVGTGYFSECYYTIEHNGRLFTKAVSACRQMTGYLRGCKLQDAASAPAAGQTQATLPTTEDWHSRPTNPAYLAAMPYVEKVKSTIKGTSPDDTLARQLTVFTYLPEMITRMREASRPYGSPWTADETRITYAYNLAAKQITDDYAKTHTPAETDALKHAEGHYELMDDKFYKQWTQAVLPKDFLDAYNKAAWGLLADYRAHVAKEQQLYDQAQAQIKAARQAAAQGSPGLPNDAGRVAVRRCLELGGTQIQCLGKGLSTSFFDLAGMKQGDLIPTSNYTGPTLTGLYKSASGIDAGFSDTTVGLGNCGKLIIDARAYRLERNGDQILIHVDNKPTAFSFLLEPDGKLRGPASAVFDGKVVTGYHRYYAYKYYRSTGQEVPGTGHWVSEPIYAPRTQACAIGTLMPGAPEQVDPGVLNDIASAIGALTGEGSESDRKGQDFLAPGIRMAGLYTSQGGLKAEFAAASVVLDCGEAHVRDKYTVERAGNQILIHVQNPASPFTATLQPDGSLSGPASVAVAGRLVTGMTGDQIAYTPSNATCSVGRLFPSGAHEQAAPATASAPAAPTPATVPSVPEAAGANSTLSVTPGYPAGANPLAGKWVFLMKKRFDDVLRANGAPLAPGTTPGQAWDALKQHCPSPANCKKLYEGIAYFFAAKVQMPPSGPGEFSPKVPAGTYYVMAATAANNRTLFWDVKVNLKPGTNSVVLDERDEESDGRSPALSAAKEPAPSTSVSSSAGDAALTVAARLPGSTNPLAGKQVFLMKERLDKIVRSGGLHLAPGASAAEAWGMMLHSCPKPTDCSALNTKMNNNIVTAFTMPASGRGAFTDKLRPGTYYVSSYTLIGFVMMVWDVKVDLKPGSNTVELNDNNGEYVK
jgi:hypothetical protein